MGTFQLHSQLKIDCHVIGHLDTGHLLLHRNAAVPWFILVPDTHTTDLLDLGEETLGRVMRDAQSVSRYVKQQLRYSKINFAAIGNVVPQLHLHIIGRREDDDCWPRPVWGNLGTAAVYSDEALSAIAEGLETHCRLRPRM